VREDRDAHEVVPAAHARRILRYGEPAQRGVDQHLRAVALLVRVVEELRDHDAVLVGDVDAGVRDAGEERVLASDLVVQDP
jgi:hypothetical protein